jgi:hypothetical protein
LERNDLLSGLWLLHGEARSIIWRPPPPELASPSTQAYADLVERSREFGRSSQAAERSHQPSRLEPEVAHILSLQRTAGNVAVYRLLRSPATEAVFTNIPLEPLPASPPQARLLASVTDEQISLALYGRVGIPIRYTGPDTVEVLYSTLLPKWKPAFRAGATPWERTGAEERERVGRRGKDGEVVWEERMRWTPVVDQRRSGMVVAFKRSSGGYTEVRNTAGEIVFVDEIPIERLRIPIVDDIGDALKQAGYAAAGLVDAWLEDNWAALGLPPTERPLADLFGLPADSIAYRIGRGGGHVLSLLQAAAEIVGGAALVVGGAGEFAVGVATTPAGGVGLVIMPVAVVTIAAGTTVVVHGGALANAVFMSAKGGGGAGGGTPKKRNPWKITKEGTAESRVSRRFGRFDKSKSDGLWWSKDTAGHGGSKWKVFREESGGLRWTADADEFGDFIVGKHKSPTGQFIPWGDLTPVP